ncbi:Uncharacterised protein [Mycobacteroides abscessus subsp. abscessus]|nr:Uncharacterised protein [Mycobacteroides abscessus subsp. abscessus]
MSDGLFEVPDEAYLVPPVPETRTRGERRKHLVAIRIGTGWHPLGYVPLHKDAAVVRGGPGLTCGDCKFRIVHRWPKCHFPVQMGETTTYPRDTGGESSDIRKWWPACRDFQPHED